MSIIINYSNCHRVFYLSKINCHQYLSCPEDLLEKDTETHSSVLAWRILWTQELGRKQSMGLQRDGPNTFTFTFGADTFLKKRRKKNPNFGILGQCGFPHNQKCSMCSKYFSVRYTYFLIYFTIFFNCIFLCLHSYFTFPDTLNQPPQRE